MNYLISTKNILLDGNNYEQIISGKNFLYLKKNFYKKVKKKKINYYIFGNISGYYTKDNNFKKINLNKIIKFINIKNISYLDGVFTIIKLYEKKKKIEIFSDHLSRSEIFYQKKPDVIISSSLEYFKDQKLLLNQIALAHSISIYGNRPFKYDTIFKNVHRVIPNQNLIIEGNKIHLKERSFKPLKITSYNETVLKNYTKAFLTTLKIRSSKKLNVIFLSSGWDSTAILAGLIKISKNKNIRCVIGRMRYSPKKCANLFEIKKAKKICDFFKLKLDIIDFDYYKINRLKNKDLIDFLTNNQLASITSVNHYYLSKHIREKYGEKITVFCGEVSDGAHNLGFSQYTTIFHPSSFNFREYSDKMNSYLFGPTFFEYSKSGKKLNDDPIYQLFKSKNKHLTFEIEDKITKNTAKLFLSSFFLRPSRIPFVSNKNLKFLTKFGQINYQRSMEKKIIDKYSILINKTNLYSIILFLYNFFHWQGSTVISFERSCEHFNLEPQLPFLDRKIIDILSKLPESCGRGLDFKNTKFLLKEMLKREVKYPIHLQSGPHSYLYDIDRYYNHNFELLYKSSFKKIFKQKLKSKKFINHLEKSNFNFKYINYLRKSYIDGKKFNGQELNDLFALCMHELVYSNIFN